MSDKGPASSLLAWRPDGRWLALVPAEDAHSVVLWEVASSAPRGVLQGHSEGAVQALAYNVGGSKMGLLATTDGFTVSE